MRTPSRSSSTVILFLVALLSAGCAQLAGAPVSAPEALALHARGPGHVFESAEAAAIDALTYAYLQSHEARQPERMRGGTIFPLGEGYSYGEIQVASPLNASRVSYAMAPEDVARFQLYPVVSDHDVNRANERASLADRRSVSVTDPLHRPLYILHPSLVVRAYRGSQAASIEVADLRRPASAPVYAGN